MLLCACMRVGMLFASCVWMRTAAPKFKLPFDLLFNKEDTVWYPDNLPRFNFVM